MKNKRNTFLKITLRWREFGSTGRALAWHAQSYPGLDSQQEVQKFKLILGDKQDPISKITLNLKIKLKKILNTITS